MVYESTSQITRNFIVQRRVCRIQIFQEPVI